MVEYVLSGAVEVRIDGQPAPLGGPKQRCVLAVLLTSPGAVVSVDRLIDAIWDESPPGKALASLRSYVANLRRILTPAHDSAANAKPRLESRAYGYRLNLLADDSVDLLRFEELVKAGRAALIRGAAHEAFDALDAALALWRGEPFGEFAHCEFAHADLLRYAALRTTAIEARFDAALQRGDTTDLLPDLEAAVAADPVQERLWGHLMLALFRAGRTADALHTFDRARAALEREVGAPPGEGLEVLHRQIRDGSPALHQPPRVPTPMADRANSTESPFVGRTHELDTIAAAVSRARVGAGSLILATGDSGIGKTALAQAVCERVDATAMAIAWAGNPTGIGVPLLWTWIQVLRQLSQALGPESRAAVRAAAPGVLHALVPEYNDSDGVAPIAPAPTGFRLTEGIVAALSALSSLRPLLLILDDLQYADPESVEALALLTAQLPRLPVQVIANWTYFGDHRPVNRESFERLAKSSHSTTIHLRGLDHDLAIGLVHDLAHADASPDLAEQVWNRTGGNPFYIRELVHFLCDRSRPHSGLDGREIPDAVAGVAGQRLGILDDAGRHALSAAAVIGDEFDVAALADTVELPVSAVHARLRPAYDAGLLDEHVSRPGAYRFSHGLLRDAILAQTRPTDRARVHAAIAANNVATLPSAAYENVIATADHAWRAHTDLDPSTALQIHEVAIRRALTRAAHDDVSVLAEHALQVCARLPAKPETLERQATLWLHVAAANAITVGQNSTAAAEAVQRAFDIGEQARGRNFYGAVALQCQLLCAHGRIDEAHMLATGLDAHYRESLDPDVGVASHFTQVMIHSLRGELDEQAATAQRMLTLFPPPETVADPLSFFHPRVYCWLGLAEAIRGNGDGAHKHCRSGLELAQSRGDVFNVLAAKVTMVEVDATLGVLDGTAAAARAVDEEISAAGALQWAACARMVAIWAEVLSTGDGDASAAFDAFDVYTHDGSTVMTPFFLALLADIEATQGRDAHAAELLDRARIVMEATGERVWAEFLGRRG